MYERKYACMQGLPDESRNVWKHLHAFMPKIYYVMMFIENFQHEFFITSLCMYLQDADSDCARMYSTWIIWAHCQPRGC